MENSQVFPLLKHNWKSLQNVEKFEIDQFEGTSISSVTPKLLSDFESYQRRTCFSLRGSRAWTSWHADRVAGSY